MKTAVRDSPTTAEYGRCEDAPPPTRMRQFQPVSLQPDRSITGGWIDNEIHMSQWSLIKMIPS